MRCHTLAGACAALLTSIACGGSGGGRAGQATVDAAAVAGYQDLAGQVQSAALSYGATMSGPGMTLAGCAAVHDAYDAQVRPLIARMVQMSGAMDGYIDAHRGMHQGTASADMTCMANAMMAELDAHRNVACSYATLGDDQAEASRHVGVMTSDASHVYGRCQTMMEAMGGQSYAWGPAAPGCGGTAGGSPTDPVVLGERVFDWGIGGDGKAIARTGGSGMMMMTGSGCAGCHGSDGHGLRTMMFTTPNITYSNLTDPAGMLDPDGGRGPTYTDDLIHRAVVQGIDADGAQLSSGMPRWQMTDQDFGNLLQFLKTLP